MSTIFEPSCGSNVNLTGVNSNVIMSGCVDDNPEDARRVFREELTVTEAATILGISERQCYRIKGRVKEHGANRVIHATRDGVFFRF